MPFMFYSKNLESLNELVFRHNIWGARKGRVQSSLENNPEHFKSGEKILWYHSKTKSFYGYSTIKNTQFYNNESVEMENDFIAFDLEDSVKFQNPIKINNQLKEDI